MSEVRDVMSLSRRDFELWLDGYGSGCCDGMDLGRKQMDDEISTMQREAHKVVLLMAKLDPWEVAQRRRRERHAEAADRHAQAAQPWPAEATP